MDESAAAGTGALADGETTGDSTEGATKVVGRIIIIRRVGVLTEGASTGILSDGGNAGGFALNLIGFLVGCINTGN